MNYTDKVKCPQGHKFTLIRRESSAGKKVATYCQQCKKSYLLMAGRPK